MNITKPPVFTTTDFSNKRLWGPPPRYPMVKAVKHTKAKEPFVIAGPCFAESEAIISKTAQFLCSRGVKYMRGGVYRAGTYPPANGEFGLSIEALKDFSYHAHKNGLKIVIEVLDYRLIDTITQFADILQVGARHMQDYALLKEVAKFNGIVTIKRGVGQTIDELLGACEYLMCGSCKPMIIERGSSTFMNHVRWDLSISAIPAIKAITGIPVIVDASHGTGRRDLVEPMTLAGIAAGADGYLVETHPRPTESLSDADQAVDFKTFARIQDKAKKIWAVR
jgi:3-deoxy-7-phosphoheptulonate synthase